MTQILQNFKNEITELFKAYRMAHFSLYNMEKTFYDFKEHHPQIEIFVIKDLDFENEVNFDEEEINKNRGNGNYQRIIAGNTIAMFYNIWEDKYRIEIANKISLSKNEIKSDFFKELNFIRQSITHNSFNPCSKLNKLDKLAFVGNSSILKLSSLEVQKIKEFLLIEIDRLNNIYIIHPSIADVPLVNKIKSN
jgi:hypothetical protein